MTELAKPCDFCNRLGAFVLSALLSSSLPALSQGSVGSGTGASSPTLSVQTGAPADSAAAQAAAAAAKQEAFIVSELQGLHNLNPDPLQTCEAAQPGKPEKHRGSLRKMVHGIAGEFAADASMFVKDSIFVFSAQDIDPYVTKPDPKKPYEAFELRIVDGSSAIVTRFPDGSAKVEGSYLDGTICAPLSRGSWVIGYPNGARGKLVQDGRNLVLYRPDKTITTMKPGMDGGYDAVNSKLGFIGT
ncbi:MAG TPA: hypothetical protein PLY72_18570, partial [Candidatus Obscuribacter sp.]|nr:hypothetical protein [Candidatus Obscuribacter sp.]